MKKKFSKSWKGSKQPRKQRKYKANAPLHLKRKFVIVNLSKPLRKEKGKRNTQLKKGDKVKILRGKFKGKQGKILSINLRTSKVVVENIQKTKQDGSKVNIKFQPSNLQIIEMTERTKKKQKQERKEAREKEKTESKKERKSKEDKK